MKRNFQILGLMILSGFLTACGGASLGDQINVFLDPAEQTAVVEVQMSDGLEVNLTGEFPIADGYGTLVFVPATKTTNAKIQIVFDLQQAIDDQLGGYQLVTELPNGAPLPVAMTPPLVRIPVIQSGSVKADAVAAIMPELQIGALVGISQFRTQYFPQGVAICQNFRNEDQVAFAAICLYGPGSQESGGIFVGGNFGDVFNLGSQQLLATSSSSRAMMSASRVVSINPLDSLEKISMSSFNWDEQRYDPRKALSGSKGQKAMKNAQKILKSKVSR